MNLPTGIDEATMALWPRALENSGLWRPGQRCEGCMDTLDQIGFDFRKSLSVVERSHKPHDIPPPAPTHELLWEMLEKLLDHGCVIHVWKELGKTLFISIGADGDDEYESLAAAVIRAMAAREVKQ